MRVARPADRTIPFDRIRAVEWENERIKLIDQRVLPGKLEYVYVDNLGDAAEAIRLMVVRGAPAIGITAAYAVVLGARDRYQENPKNWREALKSDLDLLSAARPTAVNLRWAIERMCRLAETIDGSPVAQLLEEAQNIHCEDIAANHRIGELGAALIEPGSSVLTHCNAGALATGGYGTALGVVRAAVTSGRVFGVFANETRPWLQGSRLTAWELLQEGIPVTLTADSAAATLMRQGRIRWVIVGADRIAANGDVANKIGTYALALAARQLGVKFMVAAPISTIDLETPSGADIPIEVRAGEEVMEFAGQRTAPEGAHAWNPAFDITPAELIDAIVTENGVIEHPQARTLARLVGKKG
jgi:methylthioribose-1-phosphate isomerase